MEGKVGRGSIECHGHGRRGIQLFLSIKKINIKIRSQAPSRTCWTKQFFITLSIYLIIPIILHNQYISTLQT